MTKNLLVRIARRLGRVVAVIVYFLCPGCDSPPRFGGVGTNDDHRMSPVPASPTHSINTEP